MNRTNIYQQNYFGINVLCFTILEIFLHNARITSQTYHNLYSHVTSLMIVTIVLRPKYNLWYLLMDYYLMVETGSYIRRSGRKSQVTSVRKSFGQFSPNELSMFFSFKSVGIYNS